MQITPSDQIAQHNYATDMTAMSTQPNIEHFEPSKAKEI